VNILAAMRDPSLFAEHFAGGTWGNWWAFLAALFALPLDADALALYQRHTGRTAPPTTPFREAALICGRRAGKSRVLALVATYLACFRSYAEHLAPGEVATVAVIAADRRQSRVIMRFIVGSLESIPLLRQMIEEVTAERITLTNRVVIEVGTESFRVTRGYSYAAVLADEIAFWRQDNSANPDEEIIAALRPGLASIPGSLLLMASSPYSKRGVLYSAYRKHYGRDDGRVLVWKASSLAMNASIDEAIIAEAFEADPASAAAEFGGEFRNDIAAFVAREVVDGCTVPGRYELPRISLHRYHAFIDPSGGSSDSMTLAIAHAEQDGSGFSAPSRAVLDLVREVRPPFSPEAVVADFAATLKAYGVGRVVGDRYAGEWVREPFRKLGIAYDLADRPKSDLFRDCLPLLNSGRAELLDLPKLAAQFCGLERRVARGGRDSIDHAPGAHDDVANATAGALLLTVGAGMNGALERAKILCH